MLFPTRIYTIMIGFAIEVVFVEPEDATGRYGARGLGEHGSGTIPVAIAHVVENRREGG
jgi:CO/xanthine dehydrogenase Mo-binding subunit